MLAALQKIQESIDGRIVRERALILLAALALIFMLWNFLVQAAFDKKMLSLRGQLTSLAAERQTSQSQILAATQLLLNDPNKPKLEQITQLKQDISALEQQLGLASKNLIKVEQLPEALQDVLRNTQQLTLLEVKTLPAQELRFISPGSSTSAPADANAEHQVGIYQHLVELRVSGSYGQLLQFLTALEHLPWRFYWQSLDYRVVAYPNAEVILRVYTLSTEEGLFGV